METQKKPTYEELPNLPCRDKMSPEAYKSMVLRNGITQDKIDSFQASIDRMEKEREGRK